jgi:predicted CXXCH cytochrome family protein
LYASYNDYIEFLIVYVREAHPEMLRQGNETGIIGRPKTLDERIILATACVAKYKFTIPMVIDGMDGKVNSDYRAAPVRVTVTDIDGKVAFYGGPGPFEFKLPPVERTLKKLIANGGRMPPPPVPQWSQPVNGLRCGLSFDPEKLTVGEEVTAQLKFENTTDEPINFYFQPTDAIKRFVINNDIGQTLKIEASRAAVRFRMRGRRSNPIQTIAPGEAFETEVEGKIVAASDQSQYIGIAGQFHAVYNNKIDENTLAQIDPAPTQPIWTGKLSSGVCTLNVTLPQQDGCIDCHSDSDYHHAKLQECANCHVGEMGNADFGVKDESCAQCHPRDGVYGRRQILGPGGEFDVASKHISGTIEDKDCLLCHDNSRHGNGNVSLIDPDSGGTDPWTGTRTNFCLTCHDGEPPANVSFPAKSSGSGYDKSKFQGLAHALGEQGCSYCHNSHGSPYPSLLRDMHKR